MSPNARWVLREDFGSIALLILNRPERRNALSRQLVAELSDTLDTLAAEPGTRAVILTGAPPAFCAGMDLKEAIESGGAAESSAKAVEDARAIAHLINQIHQFPRPTIAALNGPALGGGAGLALACDFVTMSSGAVLGYPEVRRGLVAAIVLHDLVRQVGDRRARQLLLTGEPIDAETAGRWGLVNRVTKPDDCLDEAIRLGERLLGAAPLAIATTKRLLDEATNRPGDLRGAAAVSAAVRDSDEAHEGMRAFVEKQSPAWHILADKIPGYDRRDEGIDPDLPTGPGPS